MAGSRHAEEYQFWRSLGRCWYCKGKDALTMSGHTLCSACAEERNAKARAAYDPETEREKNRASYNARKAAGLCVKCRRMARPGRVTCVECAIKMARRDAAREIPRKTENYPRGANGYCYQCNRVPAIKGERLCESCKPRMLEMKARQMAAQEQNQFTVWTTASRKEEKVNEQACGL